ncbi:hypothetical protein [Rhodococcus spongiicola]|uniref:Secreted protein n=1 Tax=Rhodococcus spongiicola TaxID=2487352 RepID=A0A438B566_9NOCA|nr:hypothetical protein [Rhodococcus spongiicola]RVW06145.1 hypothetical protein EF834_01400 [Rhodococcus spongiicola]
MIRSIRKPLIVAATTVGVVAGGFGATQASAMPSDAGIQAVSDVTVAAAAADNGSLDGNSVLGSLATIVAAPFMIAGTGSVMGSMFGYCFFLDPNNCMPTFEG